MRFSLTHPTWMWMYFGGFGTVAIVLFVLVVRSWMEYYAAVGRHQRPALRWGIFGYTFLFFGSWFACGVGGPPGNMLSNDPVAHSLMGATGAAVLSMFFSVPGWVCVLVSQRKLMKEAIAQKSNDAALRRNTGM